MSGKIRVFVKPNVDSPELLEVGTLACSYFKAREGEELEVAYLHSQILSKEAPTITRVRFIVQEISEPHSDFARLLSRVAVMDGTNPDHLLKLPTFQPCASFIKQMYGR